MKTENWENLTITFEVSGNYGCFYDLLESVGHKVVLAHPWMIVEARIMTDKLIESLIKGNELAIKG